MVLEYTDSLNFNEIMFRLVYARIHISIENIWKAVFYAGNVIYELEKYGVAFYEINPKTMHQLADGEVRLGSFYGVVHPFMDIKKDKIIPENLLCPELSKYKTVHFKTNVWNFGYFIYLLGGLKFAFQRLPEEDIEKTSMNFHKVLPKCKMARVYPEELTSLIFAMLTKHPDARPSWGKQLTYIDEILEYDPVKEIEESVRKRYPELEKISKDTTKKYLKPIVMYISDLDALEEKLITTYGQDSLHKALPVRENLTGRDVRMDSQMGNYNFT